MTKFVQFVRDPSGATAIEYALIASLIVVVIIGAVTLAGTNLTSLYSDVATQL